MAGKDVSEVSADLSADGDAGGFVTVADNTPFYKGAQAFLNDDTGNSVEVVITGIGASGVIYLRVMSRADFVNTGDTGLALKPPSYGNSDMSAYTVAGGWKLYQPRQFIYGAT